MAITNLISGELRNKIGGMVGAKWKGKSYVRAYVIPKNPKTPDQMATRSSFTIITKFGSLINASVLKPYQAKPVKNKSPFNVFFSLNKEFVQEKETDHAKLKIFNGSLPIGEVSVAAAAAADQKVTVSVTPAQYGLAQATDTIIAIAYNVGKDALNTATILRGTGASLSIEVPLITESDDQIIVYVTASQPKSVNGPTVVRTVTVT
jgi:hypothetical protein